MKLHVSHSAGPDPDWFVVLPLPGRTRTSVAGTPITHEMAVESLLNAGRTVIELDTGASCRHVAVEDPETGRALFTGQLLDGSPWQGWHRVQPDGPVDLPPGYKIREIT